MPEDAISNAASVSALLWAGRSTKMTLERSESDSGRAHLAAAALRSVEAWSSTKSRSASTASTEKACLAEAWGSTKSRWTEGKRGRGRSMRCGAEGAAAGAKSVALRGIDATGWSSAQSPRSRSLVEGGIRSIKSEPSGLK